MRPTPTARPAETAPGLRMLSLAMACAGALLGTAMQMRLAELPRPGFLWLALGVVVLLLLLGHWPLSRRPGWASAARPALWLLAVATAAFALVSLRAHERLAERLPAALEGRDIVVTGLVAQLPRSGLQGTRFLFDVEAASLDGRAVALPRVVSLGWFRGAEPDALLLGPQVEVRAGQRWRFTVRLRQPHGPFNPGGFDLELWLFERGIGATGQVRARAGDAATLMAEGAGVPIEQARQWVRDAIERRLAGPDEGRQAGRIAGVIAALAVGDQAAIEREDWELFRVTGVAHLMSISGLHVTMFAWLAGGVIGWLWRRSARLIWRLPAPLAARWGGVLVALAYALFAGWGVPAQRTVCMLATVAALQSLGARWPLHAVLLATAAVVVAVDPWALQQPGFWLSFVAVGLLAASEPVGDRRRGGGSADATPAQRAAALARSALRTQAVATVGLAPLSLVFFQQVSLVGFAANLVAIPVVTLLVTPLSLLGVLIAPLWDAAALVLSGLMLVLQGLAGGGPGASSGLPAPWSTVSAVWQAAAAPSWATAAGLLGGLVAVLPLPWRLRALALPLMLPLLAPAVPRPAEGRFELVALDVGQGTAALVRTRRHLLLYDTGPALSPESDAGSRLVVPLLRRRGETHIDHLVLSHRDVDHVGGAGAVLAAMPVRRLSSSLDEAHPLLAQARAAGAALHRCEAGQGWEWDGVRFEVLHPTPADFGRSGQPSAEIGGPVPSPSESGMRGLRPNALSCVLRVTSNDTSVLLTGDIEAAQEAALRERDVARLRARLMLVPHHGSRTSSTAAFIDAVAPELALAQAGYRSRFGHPAADVVARYEARGIPLARSDRCGALTLAPGGAARCEREAARRYWHHRADDHMPLPTGG